MNGTPNYITPEGAEKLRQELKELLHVERPQLVKTVAWAASNGDRSENADYIYGKRRLREIDKRIAFLTNKIEVAEIVDPKTVRSERIVFGASVTVVDEKGVEKSFQIVGEDEIDAEKGRISWRSPVAAALLGKKIGDEIIIRRPAGDWFVEVTQIEFK
jgi:transcription elongation factor GreB